MLTHVWNKSELQALNVLSIVWTISVAVFFMWWLDQSHIGTVTGFVIITTILTWGFLLSAYCFYLIFNMRQIVRSHKFLNKFRVAMIVTKAPSEPLDVIQRTLQGMLSQAYPHDTWVADEDPTPEALAWYKAHNIQVSCRKNKPNYHNDTWPRRKKCKEGNLAFFYDTYGYKKYDIVSQLDADHVPESNYLVDIVAPFSNPKVGYVAAASICDANADASWASRARLQAESVFHGPIQSGSNEKLVPLCIGSHYAVRTKALKSIGGIGPELAEDYSTSMLMQAHGWQGIWTYSATAHGDGPNTFEDLMVQDYQWAKSLVILFFTLFPKQWLKLSWRHRLFFLFTQLWYVVNTVVWIFTLCVPLVALWTGESPVVVQFTDFLIYFTPPYIVTLLLYSFNRSRGHLRPQKINLISWENGLFELARWPWVLVAIYSAVVTVVTKKHKTFKVTPKGDRAAAPLSLRVLSPYAAIAILNTVVLSISPHTHTLPGYKLFSAASGAVYILLMFAIIGLHIHETGRKNYRNQLFEHTPHLLLSSGLCFILLVSLLI